MTYQQKLKNAVKWVRKLRESGAGVLFLDLQQEGSNDFRISFFPEGNKESAVRTALDFAGKVTKGSDGTVTANGKDGVICVFGVLNCKIVGTKKVQRPIMVQQGVEEIEEPVYDCRLPIEG